MSRLDQAITAATQASRDDDQADQTFGVDAAELQRRRMYVTAILEADPDLAL